MKVTLHLGLERPRVYSDLSPEDKERYNADIRATNILLPTSSLELTKEDRESQLYDDFEHFCQHKRETIHDYYVWFAKLINDIRNIKMTMSRMQLNSKFVNNMLPEWGRFVTTVKLNRGLRDSNYDQLYAYLKQHEAHWLRFLNFFNDPRIQKEQRFVPIRVIEEENEYSSLYTSCGEEIGMKTEEVVSTIDRKQSQNDKTEHGMEKTVQNQAKSKNVKVESIMKESAVKPEPGLRILLDAIFTQSDGPGKANILFMRM
ncbi:hypothetical protein Tco_0686947 [Tanacetum coccineum]